MATYVALNPTKIDSDITPPGLKYTQPPKMTFKVEVTIDDKIYKDIQKDGILLEEMNDVAKKVYDQTTGAIRSQLAAFDKLIATMIDKGAPKDQIKKQIDGLNKSLEQSYTIGHAAATKGVEAVWKDYLKKKKEYTKYKIKIVAKVGGSVAGLVTSISLMATAPFTGGASAAISIIGMFKSAVTIAKELRLAWIELSTARKELEVELAILKTMVGKNKAKLIGNEVGAAIVKQFFGAAQPHIKGCSAKMDTIEKKLLGAEIKSHDASKILNRILDEQGKFKKDFLSEARRALEKKLGTVPKTQIADIEKELNGEMDEQETRVMLQIAHVSELYEHFKSEQKKAAKLRKEVDKLEKARGAGIIVFEQVLSLADIGLSLLDGNVLAKGVELEKNLGSAAASFAYDKLSGRVLEKTWLS